MSNLSSTADDILACARALIVKRGYEGFSYADIAEVVGIRKASIHHHFPSKVDLVRTLVSRYRADAASGLDSLDKVSSDPHVQLSAYIRYWQACVADEKADFCICALLAAELPALPEPVAAEVRLHFKSLSTWLLAVFERGAEQGSMRLSASPHIEAEAFMATVHGGMVSARAYGDPTLFTAITNLTLQRLTA
ncbi:MAG: TetR/AcrR family transcriptional regulator [Candidatus Devosia phytovorans]|uniref:TetR/AcrR family transcriptional regulator n=1 Tax=Candidatus Devosia phytovorans TaxID=3121372 RepID=A0AAJ5VXK4_9HYPH|nr:TetR/AcrR family transcriptional regulator [Devosia sp.]WEK05343.1 MAG: TetR/AcrR family transcriptional regulator [Devosia sp.]